MNPLFFWSLAPSRSRPPSLRVPLRRLRRFFVRIPSDYGRFEVPRIIEEGGGAGFKARERGEGNPFYHRSSFLRQFRRQRGARCILWDERGFSRRVLRGILHPSLFVRILFAVRGILLLGTEGFSRVALIPRSIKYQEMKRFVERIIVCKRESKSKLFEFVSAIY